MANAHNKRKKRSGKWKNIWRRKIRALDNTSSSESTITAQELTRASPSIRTIFTAKVTDNSAICPTCTKEILPETATVSSSSETHSCGELVDIDESILMNSGNVHIGNISTEKTSAAEFVRAYEKKIVEPLKERPIGEKSKLSLNLNLNDVEEDAIDGLEVEASSVLRLDFLENFHHNDCDDGLDTLTSVNVYGGYEVGGSFVDSGHCTSYSHDTCEDRPVDSISVCDASRVNIPDSTESVKTHAAQLRNNQSSNFDTTEEITNLKFSELEEEPDQDAVSTDNDLLNQKAPFYRSIVNVEFLWQQLQQKIDDHPCPLSALKLKKKFDFGLKSRFEINCERCDYITSIWTDCKENGVLGVNESAVCGTLTAGIGCSTMQELLVAIGLPAMSQPTYRKHRNRFYEVIKKTTVESMKAAAIEESTIARNKGQTINDIPYIKVIVDGAWAKRSYTGGKHDSLSGVAVIVGHETGKVLFVGVRNKYCAFEAKAEQLGKEPGEHVCFKNWGRDQSSNGMEKDIIVEGFMCSVEMHGLIYKTIIADGDASTHQAIRDANPYRDYAVLVDKIECNNHLFRNMCKKIRAASMLSFSRTLHASLPTTVAAFRSRIEKSGLQIRLLVERARDCRNGEDASNDEKRLRLVEDIFIIFDHVFGEHSGCNTLPFACESKTGDENLVNDLRKTGIYPAVYEAVSYLSRYADSLLHDVTNNMAEAFNSIVNKGNAGKRTNQCATNSYEIRCYVAVLQHNSQSGLSEVYKGLGKIVPDSVEVLESSRKLQISRNRLLRQTKGQRRRKTAGSTDKDYGPLSQQPDLPDSTYQILKEKHLDNLKQNQENRVQIERETHKQSDCELWHSLRLDIITASKFGAICRMQKTTSCAVMVANIRYPKVLNTAAVQFGIANEQIAKAALEQKLGIKIEPCGLFIDPAIPYLGASPDGLIGLDGIVEIKCPYSTKDMMIEDAIELRPNLKSIFDRTKKDQMSKTHAYYYQVQGQLHVTQRSYCIFALWTSVDLKYVKVLRDDEFWRSQMEPYLCRFYMECLLPEIVDSRRNRSVPIRDPEYILQAKEEAKLKKKSNSELQKKPKGKEACQETPAKIVKICVKNDSPSIMDDEPATQETDCNDNCNCNDRVMEKVPNRGWVTIDLHDDTDVDVATMAALIEVARDSITLDEVIADVLPIRNLLNDSSLDWFLRIVSENSSFHDFNAACYTAYYKCIKYCTISRPDMQIIGGNQFRHWCCAYYDGTQIKIYDSLGRVEYETMNRDEKRYVERRYGHVLKSNFTNVELPRVTKQPDSYSCGVYAAAFATTIALGGNPEDIQYSQDPNEMRSHLITIIESRILSPFPTIG